MNWILGFLFILIIIFIYSNYIKKKKIAKLKKWLIGNWGKPKTNDYFNFYVIGKYFENNEYKNKAFHIISEKVKIDLDIDELFKFIDRTSSKIGQQYLYYKLRTIGSLENLIKFDILSNLFLNNEVLRFQSQLSLSKLNSNNSYDLEKLITDKPIEKPTYLKFIYASSLTSVLLVILTFFNSNIFYKYNFSL